MSLLTPSNSLTSLVIRAFSLSYTFILSDSIIANSPSSKIIYLLVKSKIAGTSDAI